MNNEETGKPAALKGRLVMVMERIGGFSNLGRTLLDRFQGFDRADAPDSRRQASTDNSVSAVGDEGPSRTLDKADISSKAHQLNELRNAVDSGREALAQLPEVRSDRVAAVKERLNRGYYNSLEVRTQVAAKLNDVARTLEEL
jgi:hypothetical protein